MIKRINDTNPESAVLLDLLIGATTTLRSPPSSSSCMGEILVNRKKMRASESRTKPSCSGFAGKLVGWDLIVTELPGSSTCCT